MTLYRKHRPQKFSDLVGQDHIRDTLLQAVKENKLSHAYLFTGPRGTGKTSTARLVAKAVNCLELHKDSSSGEPCGKCENCLEITAGRALDIIEIDAASNRGIDEIRELREQVKFAPSKAKFKVYIIDEVHMLTREAFNALLKTLEEPPKHAMFVLATTEIHKVLPTIISRSQRFDFKRIGVSDLVKNLQKVIKAEKLQAEDEALEAIALQSEGGGRDSLSLLEQVASFSGDITMNSVRAVLGLVEIAEIVNLLRAIFNSHAEEGLKIAHSLYEGGTNLVQLNTSLLDVLRKLMTYAVAGEFLAEDTAENKRKISDLYQELLASHPAPAGYLLGIIKNFVEAGKMMKETIDPLVAMEVAIVESINFPQNPKSEILNPKQIQEYSNNSKLESKLVTEKSNDKEDKKDRDGTVDKSDNNNLTIQQFNNNPKNSLKEIDQKAWESVVGEIRKENTTLAALLKDAKPMTVEEGKLLLGVRFKFHKDKISEAKNVQIIEGVVCNVTGNSCRVACEIADFSAARPKQSHSDDELAAEAERVFGD